MTLSISRWLLAAACLCAWGLGMTPVAAQSGSSTSSATSDASGEATSDDSTSTVSNLEDIDEILQGENEVQAGGGYTYDAGGRRDPFKSLLIVAKNVPAGARPDGIPGLLIDELELSGIFRTRNGYVAQVQAAEKQKSFLIKVGDQLYDGDVIAISKSEVVFKQYVKDPTALKPFREVVKSLKP